MLTSDAAAPSLPQSAIESGLRRLGLRRGHVVEVHSSLWQFGPVVGGATTIIAALQNAVGSDGTIVMSAYPVSPALKLTADDQARGITWKVRLLHPDSLERSGMGIIADTFRQRADVVCGLGVHRVCAWGHEAQRHSEGYHQLLADDGWVLLMGVGIDRCSSIHQAEAIGLPPQIAALFELPADIRRDYPADQWGIGFGSTSGDPWGTIWRDADRRGLIRRQIIGRAECSLFKAKPMVSAYEARLRSDPYTLFGVTPNG